MKRSKTSKAWMQEHVADHFVQRAKAAGYRSRAAFKLLEIDDRDHLFRAGGLVVDLGAAPGSWSQVAAARVGPAGRVVALDLLEIVPMAGVEVLQGDFTEAAMEEALAGCLAGRRPDVVLSDMAPNLSGITSADQARGIHLCELALEFATTHLTPDGRFLVKVFQGAGFPEFRRAMQAAFKTVVSRKPEASRDRSAEMYLLGIGLKP
ncbi:MAG: RlmE family RNA methyltransferase [Zoogloeaceae bacterium]|nr:RlmE family RNA methyltransferase [Zoogloeaceae bacterium]